MKTKTKKKSVGETTVIHSELKRVDTREILVEVSEWVGNDDEIRLTLKIEVWNLANRKNYAIWLPIGDRRGIDPHLETLIGMLKRVPVG